MLREKLVLNIIADKAKQIEEKQFREQLLLMFSSKTHDKIEFWDLERHDKNKIKIF